MKSSVFQYPYLKVYRRTKGILSQMGMKIVRSDSVTGHIQAKSGFSLSKPPLKIDLVVEEMDSSNTRVTISGIQEFNLFFQKKKDTDTTEKEILDAIASLIV